MQHYTVGGQDHIAEAGPEEHDLDRWTSALAGIETKLPTPEYLLGEDPLRHALLAEFAFQAIAEDKATRAITALVAEAPDSETLEFYASQLVDEARHRRMYREHIRDLGVPAEQLDQVINQYAEATAELVLAPIERYGLEMMAQHQDFYRGVLVVTVLVEGVVAPITELSERKWRPLDPEAGRIQRVANRDETRHLAVGGTIIHRYLKDNPDKREGLLDVVHAGRELWDSVPMEGLQLMMEQVFQQGMELHRDLVGGHEIWPGRRMIDTTPEERTAMASRWVRQIQEERLEYMMLSDR
ncbi:VlmB-like protein [Lentzea tibetensis]|uniref:VlmB-like protein n=1 Tax=Lentzea tibetensis TaxID=2591470 RepID=A0A563ETB5_9PSEU|nr:VlmB-like protein [Lentzea tibetensis]TWP50893.1 VlmB-like protein [Lentzea tibetensis]